MTCRCHWYDLLLFRPLSAHLIYFAFTQLLLLQLWWLVQCGASVLTFNGAERLPTWFDASGLGFTVLVYCCVSVLMFPFFLDTQVGPDHIWLVYPAVPWPPLCV